VNPYSIGKKQPKIFIILLVFVHTKNKNPKKEKKPQNIKLRNLQFQPFTG